MADQDVIWGGCPRPREVLASDEVDLDPSLDLWDAHGGLERGQRWGDCMRASRYQVGRLKDVDGLGGWRQYSAFDLEFTRDEPSFFPGCRPSRLPL